MEKKKVQFKDDQVLIKIEDNFMTSEVDGEIVIMNPNSGEYFGLDEISSNIWKLIDSKKSFNDIVGELIKIYEVTEAKCKEDSRPIFIRLLQLKFLKFQEE